MGKMPMPKAVVRVSCRRLGHGLGATWARAAALSRWGGNPARQATEACLRLACCGNALFAVCSGPQPMPAAQRLLRSHCP